MITTNPLLRRHPPIVLSILILVLGVYVFKRNNRKFAEVMRSQPTVTMNTNDEGAVVASERSDDVVLSVKHVGKYFRLPTEQATGLKQAFINWTKGIKGYRTTCSS